MAIVRKVARKNVAANPWKIVLITQKANVSLTRRIAILLEVERRRKSMTTPT
ncbi:MAG: hypothetical protein II838_15000 [Lachnospiraceae bacterium]|nr:hypothetical protein [Lachnospiraceae bacterium]